MKENQGKKTQKALEAGERKPVIGKKRRKQVIHEDRERKVTVQRKGRRYSVTEAENYIDGEI